MSEEINAALNEVLVRLFRDINTVEERAVKHSDFKDITVNDMHVIDAIDCFEPKNMSTVAKLLSVTMGTLTISVNGLVKKGYVERVRSDKDRRVVLISLTEKGKGAHSWLKAFHRDMIKAVIDGLDLKEEIILKHGLDKLSAYFSGLLQDIH